MNLSKLKPIENIEYNPKLNELVIQFNQLIEELEKHPLSESVIVNINQDIEEINSATFIDKTLDNLIKKKQANIIKIVEKEHKIVPKGYYQKIWTALGMTTFGLPLGVVFGLLMKNMGLMALGLPIGLGIGSLVGRNMDQKAEKEGRQLNV